MKNNNSKFSKIWILCIVILSTLCVYGVFSQTKETYSVENYIVTLDQRGGAITWITKTVEAGTTINLPEPTKDGAIFEGWYTSTTWGKKVTLEYTPTDNITLYARWKYKLTYVAPGAFIGSSITGRYNKVEITPEEGWEFSMMTAEKTEYNFIGWYEDEECKNHFGYAGKKITLDKSLTLYACWKKIPTTTTIKLEPNGGTLPDGNTITVNIGDLVKDLLPIPEKKDYKFYGWYEGMGWNNPVAPSYRASYNYFNPTTTFYARYQYIITYDTNGGELEPGYGQEIYVLPGDSMNLATATKDGYTFMGWYTANTGGKKVDAPYKPSKPQTLYARWQKNSNSGSIDSTEMYFINYDPNGGGDGNIMTGLMLDKGDVYTVLENNYIAPLGKKFVNWKDENGKIYNPGDKFTVSSNKTLYAQWEDVVSDSTSGSGKYKITYDVNGGSSVTKQTSHNGSTQITLDVPIHYGYMFSGWSKSSDCSTKKYNGGETISGQNITLYACWETIENNKRCSVRNNPETNDKYIFVLIALAVSTIAYIYSYVIMKKVKQ